MNWRINSWITISLVILALVAGYFSATMTQQPASYVGCTSYGKAIKALESERRMTFGEGARDNLSTAIAEIRQQAIDAGCLPEDVSESTDDEASQTASPGSDDASSTTADAADTDDQATSDKDEADQSADNKSDSSEKTWFKFFFYEPDKVGARDFGPSVDGTEDEVIAEFKRRMSLDPALLCAKGAKILDHHPGQSVLGCTKQLMADQEAHNAYLDKVMAAIVSMEVVTKPAGRATSGYMVDVDGVPSALDIAGVARPEPYQVLRIITKSGQTVDGRLLCGFQPDETEHAPASSQADSVQPTGIQAAGRTTTRTVSTSAQSTDKVVKQKTKKEKVKEKPETKKEKPETKKEKPETKKEKPGKDSSLDSQAQGNISEQVGDGDDKTPNAKGCVNGGIRDRNGVCQTDSEAAVESSDAESTYEAPAEPTTEVADDIETGDDQDDNSGSENGSAPSQEAEAPGPEDAEVGGETSEETREDADDNDGEDNAFGETAP